MPRFAQRLTGICSALLVAVMAAGGPLAHGVAHQEEAEHQRADHAHGDSHRDSHRDSHGHSHDEDAAPDHHGSPAAPSTTDEQSAIGAAEHGTHAHNDVDVALKTRALELIAVAPSAETLPESVEREITSVRPERAAESPRPRAAPPDTRPRAPPVR